MEQDHDSSKRRESHSTAAARLLRHVERDGTMSLAAVARLCGIHEQTLIDCREGKRSLPYESQMRLAAAVASLSTQHARPARRLYAHAQAALRAELEPGRTHSYYPKSDFR